MTSTKVEAIQATITFDGTAWSNQKEKEHVAKHDNIRNDQLPGHKLQRFCRDLFTKLVRLLFPIGLQLFDPKPYRGHRLSVNLRNTISVIRLAFVSIVRIPPLP